MTKIIGITGGIGSGKSTLSNYLIKKGFLVHESDKVVSNIYKKKNKNFISFIKKCGLDKVIKNKKIDKKLISINIFNNKKLKKNLKNIFIKKLEKKERFLLKKIKVLITRLYL